jgi:predicted Rossmann-fold nucleotide-binding protein
VRSGRAVTEVESLEEFDRLVAGGARSMRGWRLQDVDLRGRSEALRRLDPAGSLFLGGLLTKADDELLRRRGALVFPEVPDLPFDAYRSALYTPEELYAGLDRHGYAGTFDARVFAWSRQATNPGEDLTHALACALHDHAVDDALAAYVAGRRVVGVMGGHELTRDDPAYADTAALGRALARSGLLVATGGGPGAMEAANLGARLAPLPDDALSRSLVTLANTPAYTVSVTDWARAGFAVPTEGGGASLGIPTWFYGYEPSNVFAAQVAKYFRNAIREDLLLHVCTAGIVFLPGAAGTVQEIFQDACENYYATPPEVAPMVLVGGDYWTRRLPAWPLLRALTEGRAMADRVHLVESVDQVPALLARSGDVAT